VDAAIEAVKGKTYRITKQHGPWMIMVTSLRGETAEAKKKALQAAHDLVLELRQKQIPAYIYTQEGALDGVDAVDRNGNPNRSYVAAQRDRVSVIAGNYPSFDDETAQKTLKYVKNMRPKSLAEGIYRPTPGRPSPLSRAFLAPNPLLSQEEIDRFTKERDPLLVRLNTGDNHNLLENRGKYTLVVASFLGKSQMQLLNPQDSAQSEKLLKFDKDLQSNSSLDQAGYDSWALVQAMRAQGLEAYVFHDRFRSIVTIGSFDSPKDPRIPQHIEKFRAKYKLDPESKKQCLTCEAFQTPAAPQPAQRTWLLDPLPQLMDVPRLR
jgi:hypothetical protein